MGVSTQNDLKAWRGTLIRITGQDRHKKTECNAKDTYGLGLPPQRRGRPAVKHCLLLLLRRPEKGENAFLG